MASKLEIYDNKNNFLWAYEDDQSSSNEFVIGLLAAIKAYYENYIDIKVYSNDQQIDIYQILEKNKLKDDYMENNSYPNIPEKTFGWVIGHDIYYFSSYDFVNGFIYFMNSYLEDFRSYCTGLPFYKNSLKSKCATSIVNINIIGYDLDPLVSEDSGSKVPFLPYYSVYEDDVDTGYIDFL